MTSNENQTAIIIPGNMWMDVYSFHLVKCQKPLLKYEHSSLCGVQVIHMLPIFFSSTAYGSLQTSCPAW